MTQHNIGDITFTYLIFISKLGKGYGCFAIKKNKEDECGEFYEVAASFCNPLDRSKFSKKIARMKATNKLNGRETVRVFPVQLESERTDVMPDDMRVVVLNAITKGLRMPSWARKGYVFPLKLDCLTHKQLVVRIAKESGVLV